MHRRTLVAKLEPLAAAHAAEHAVSPQAHPITQLWPLAQLEVKSNLNVVWKTISMSRPMHHGRTAMPIPSVRVLKPLPEIRFRNELPKPVERLSAEAPSK